MYLEVLAPQLETAGIEVDLVDTTLSFCVAGEAMPYLFKMHAICQEIWLSSPISGGNRFRLDLSTGCWTNIRTPQEGEPQTLNDLLNQELSPYGVKLLT